VLETDGSDHVIAIPVDMNIPKIRIRISKVRGSDARFGLFCVDHNA
jgi:hypothetical protein